jgi:ribosomal-protein-alanine N-acetyltransferase
VLKGQTINLRTVRKRDLDTLYDLHCQIQDRGLYFPQKMRSEAEFMDSFAKNGFWAEDKGLLLIVDAETDRILGNVAYFPANGYYQAFELGYLIYDPKDRGKGIVSQAIRLFIGYLFDLQNVTRLQIQMEIPNAASRRIAEKAGFKLEGIAREAIISQGKPVDLEVYSMLRSEWETMTRTMETPGP